MLWENEILEDFRLRQILDVICILLRNPRLSEHIAAEPMMAWFTGDIYMHLSACLSSVSLLWRKVIALRDCFML